MSEQITNYAVNENSDTCLSRIERVIDKCTFMWSIENYSLYYSDFEAGQCLYSSKFKTGMKFNFLEWQLAVRPCNIVDNVGHMGVYLLLCERNLESNGLKSINTINLKVILMNANDDIIQEKFKSFTLADFKISNNDSMCGWYEFMDIDGLLRKVSGHSKNMLKVSCSLEVTHKAKLSEIKSDSYSIDSKAKLSSDFKALCDNPQHSDIILRTKNVDFHAHKAILSARSSVFSGMFNHSMKESLDNIVCISDIAEPVLKAMLQFIYCGRLEKVSSKYYPELYSAADKYCMLDLKQKCAKKIAGSLNFENWYAIANLTELHDESELYSAISEFISSNFSEVVTSIQWAQLVLEKPEFVLKLVKPQRHDYSDPASDHFDSDNDESEWESDF